MYKAHKTIWLQVDPDGESYDPEHHDVDDDCTWCKDQINENDVKYIRADLVDSALKAFLAEPVAWTHSCPVLCLDGVELWIDKCPHCGKPAPKGMK